MLLWTGTLHTVWLTYGRRLCTYLIITTYIWTCPFIYFTLYIYISLCFFCFNFTFDLESIIDSAFYTLYSNWYYLYLWTCSISYMHYIVIHGMLNKLNWTLHTVWLNTTHSMVEHYTQYGWTLHKVTAVWSVSVIGVGSRLQTVEVYCTWYWQLAQSECLSKLHTSYGVLDPCEC
jgi:hypothetical protein